MTHSTDRTPASSAPDAADGWDPRVVAWVAASCERHGVPVKVTDAAVVARVGVLLATADPPGVPGPAPVCSGDGDGAAAA